MGYATPPTLINKFSHPKFIGQHNDIDRLRHTFNNNNRVIAGHRQCIPLRLATLLKSRRGQPLAIVPLAGATFHGRPLIGTLSW